MPTIGRMNTSNMVRLNSSTISGLTMPFNNDPNAQYQELKFNQIMGEQIRARGLTLKENQVTKSLKKPRQLQRMTTVPENAMKSSPDFGLKKINPAAQRFNLTTGKKEFTFSRKRLSARAHTVNMSEPQSVDPNYED